MADEKASAEEKEPSPVEEEELEEQRSELEEEASGSAVAEDEAVAGEALDLEKRILCSDGACIGLIGANARCKVCGAPIADEDRAAFERTFGPVPDAPSPDEAPPSTEEEDEESDEALEGASSEVEEQDGPAEEEIDDAAAESWDDRRLCSDGACIGVIGPNGRCRECGKPLEGDEA